MQQSKLSLVFKNLASVFYLTCFRCIMWSGVSFKATRCVWGVVVHGLKQTGRNRDGGRYWDTVGHSVMHEQEHTCRSESDRLTHGTHRPATQVLLVSTFLEVEPVSWCRAVLNFRGHLRHSEPGTHIRAWPHMHAHEWTVDSALLP